jgi:hypothetical protein
MLSLGRESCGQTDSFKGAVKLVAELNIVAIQGMRMRRGSSRFAGNPGQQRLDDLFAKHQVSAHRPHAGALGLVLNLIECVFSKMARTFLRHIRVASLDELKSRILKGVDEMNQLPVVFRWNKFDMGVTRRPRAEQ